MKLNRITGLHTAIYTPMDRRGELAMEHFPALIEFQQAAGIDGLVVCGTNGEGVSLSVSERKLALDTVMQHRGDLTIIAGTGAGNITDTVELTQHAAEAGADAALALPPFFFKSPSDDGIAEYFKPLLDCADLPILLYSIPQFSAVPITNGVLDLLVGHPNLAGVKDSAGDRARTLELIERYPDLTIFAGSDRLAADCWAAGGSCISGGANAFPEVVAAVRDAFRSGGEQAARQAQQRLDALIEITTKYAFVANGKAVLANRGLPRLGMRPPLQPLSESQEAALMEDLRAAQFV